MNSFLNLLFSLLLLFTIHSNKKPAVGEEKPPASIAKPISYLALGDSYTIGTSISKNQSWPFQLSDSLKAEGIKIDTTHIIATNGWTTTDLKHGIEQENIHRTYTLVSLLIGVNNQYQGMDIEIYKTEFRELLEQAVKFAGDDTSNVFVVSIPNYGVTPFAESRNPEKIHAELVVYNDIAENISSEYGIPFINITPVSEQAADDLSLLASDELHPSAKMYSFWISEMLPAVYSIIHN